MSYLGHDVSVEADHRTEARCVDVQEHEQASQGPGLLRSRRRSPGTLQQSAR